MTPKHSSPPDETTVDGRMLLTEFFKKNPHLDSNLQTLLTKAGFKTAAALSDASDETFEKSHLKSGEMEELKAALRTAGLKPRSLKDRPDVHGGVGGGGGRGGEKGGPGGIGQGALVQPDHIPLSSNWFQGGKGGKGGDIIPNITHGVGGAGGTGERGGIMAPLYLPPGTAVKSTLLLADFCSKYKVPNSVKDLLVDAGFERAATLLSTTEEAFASCRLKQGHIEEVRRALGEWKLDLSLGQNMHDVPEVSHRSDKVVSVAPEKLQPVKKFNQPS
ncbi:hypothetical protein C8R43DRAFT_957046 [Mycena crocata]|nr:hypothetical protein C8R43DRAFT_957046 [Mycena crocata]